MNQKLLNFTPKRYRCPYCGEWHNWDPENDYWDQETHLGYYKSANCKATLSCEIRSKYHDSGKLTYSFENGYCHYKTVSSCNISGEIPIKDIVENPSDGTATFSVPIDRVYRAECLDCRNPSNCLICALDEPSRSRQKKITLGFEFDTAVFELLSKVSRMESLLQELAELKSGLKKEEENMMNHVANNKEGNMATSIFSQLYHHSPEENVGIVKDWVEKYKPTLKWAVPVLTIYGAYRILNNKNSGLTVDNIDTVSSEKLGFSFDSVKDKKSLKHLMVLGGLSAGAYASIKAVSYIHKETAPQDLSVEQVEETINKVDEVRKSFSWIQPKTEALLPVATAVIVVYLMTQKPTWFETIKTKTSNLAGDLYDKVDVYLEIAKLWLADKFHINLEDEKQLCNIKKFAILASIVGICVLLYGKKVLSKETNDDIDDTPSSLKPFVNQLLEVMKKLMPSVFSGIGAYLISKKVLVAEDNLFDFFEEELPEEQEKSEVFEVTVDPAEK